MTDRITKLFEEKKNILNIYFTAGFPALNDTKRIIQALEASGADMIEIGMPYSDPMADGPTIQKSNEVAIENGMGLSVLFEQLKDLRSYCSIPVVLMGYVNPVMVYGIERFLDKCAEVGVDGTILPDLPFQEYQDEYKAIYEKHGLKNIFLITPQTTDDRIRAIDDLSGGFIYVVSSFSITGAKSGIDDQQVAYFERINGMNLKNPTLIGFGISNNETFTKACENAQGAIIGSAFVKLMANSTDIESDIEKFVKEVKG